MTTSEKVITLELTEQQLEMLRYAMSRAMSSTFWDEEQARKIGDHQKADRFRSERDQLEQIRALLG